MLLFNFQANQLGNRSKKEVLYKREILQYPYGCILDGLIQKFDEN